MKKQTAVVLVLLLLPLLSFGQTRVDAAEIIAKINRGESVAYQNATIQGDLDLTRLANMRLKNDESSLRPGQQKFYVSTVTVPVSFANCTFTGKVLGYFNPDNLFMAGTGDLAIINGTSSQGEARRNEIYSTNFGNDFRFTNCAFEELVTFKHSEFKGEVTFAGCTFRREANFKHSHFAGKGDFRKSVFEGDANFKHVHFPEHADFSQASFRSEANFKHTDFSRGVNFRQAEFAGFANFKHTNLAGNSNMEGAVLKGSHDFKHTSLNGQRFPGPGQGER